MLWNSTTVPLGPRMPRAAPRAPPAAAPAASAVVNVCVTSTLMFAGNDTTFSR